MRKAILFTIIVCIAMMTVGTGCTNKKVETEDSVAQDSIITVPHDTIDSTSTIIEETPMPKAADQLFDDFFFNFIANKKLQRNRIKFPLRSVDANGKVSEIKKEQWKTDQFFRRQGYYTLIFDDNKHMEAAKSTDIDSVIVEKIYLKQGIVEQYCFDHQEGTWRLSEIRKVGFNDNHNASFLNFLPKFFAENNLSYVKNPLPYYGPDPNGEETAMVRTKIAAAEWSSFLPEVPKNMIYNILYGQKNVDSNQKILTFRGLSNGVETQLVFKKKGNGWQLVKINAS
ncbi:MAG: DUF4348 domain-containing protein [Prevotella sp.]|nr:DUF4348 domain-containing protein [Prevotella sp.]MDD7272596.1 DUF4348 domain-containing protein [Prevotellaceae bacterium]MDY3936715.1 DUF4348 domain-containing protein [Prevotella sp.]MDY4217771.1 DUF4348 domain-containing protein [Prevotella sp.]